MAFPRRGPLLLHFWTPLILILAVSAMVPSPVMGKQEGAQAEPGVEDVAEALREHYYDRSWALGAALGKPWAEEDPTAHELHAWYALNLARDGQVDEALVVAGDLLARAPEDPWATFAMAGSVFRHRERYPEALKLSEKALAMAPDNMDVLSLRADVIRSQEGPEEAVAFIDKLPPEKRDHPLVAIRKAVALDRLASDAEDLEKGEEAYAFFREVMERDTTFLEPVFLLASRLQGARRMEEALPLLRRACALSPSHDVHRYLWRAIQSSRDLTEEEKLHQIEEDVQKLFAEHGENEGALLAVANTYESAQHTEKRDSVWNRILVMYPDSRSAEWVLVNQYRDVRRRMAEAEKANGKEDKALAAEYRRRLEEFLMRPVHHRETLRGDAYRGLFGILSGEENVDPEFLYSVVRGVELYEGINLHIIHAQAPIALADAGAHLEYAEALARRGMTEVEAQMEEYRTRNVFRSEEDMERAEKSGKSTMLDALGWVLFRQGKIDEAEELLVEAFQLNDQSPTVLYHLGKIYEGRHEHLVAEGEDAPDLLDQALDFYLKGSLVPTPATNPNDAALEELYGTVHAGMDGFEDFLAAASETDADARKAKTLAERLEEPKALADFEMDLFGGSTLSSESLEGKVVAINFWGVWCGPCVIEMPGIQEVYDRYAEDDEVVILTLSNDENPQTLARFMEKEGYTFPVLLDDGYVRREGIRAFPTTWFIDREGRIWFEKRGWSEELAEEFSWRIEALRGAGDPGR